MKTDCLTFDPTAFAAMKNFDASTMFQRTGAAQRHLVEDLLPDVKSMGDKDHSDDDFLDLIDSVLETSQDDQGLFEPVPVIPQSLSPEPSLRDLLCGALGEIDAVSPNEYDSLFDQFEPSRLIIHNKRTFNDVFPTASAFSLPSKPDAKRRKLVRQVTADAPTTHPNDNSAPRFRPYQQQQWDAQFQELLTFKQERGHCGVPHTFDENPMLSRWVKRQRYQYKLREEGKASTITANRIQLLENVGFVWDSHSAAWEERLNELRVYLLQYGHCNVPSTCSHHPQLATWVKCQRRQYKLFCSGKPSNITAERITALNQLGFIWDMRGAANSSK